MFWIKMTNPISVDTFRLVAVLKCRVKGQEYLQEISAKKHDFPN